MAGENEGLKPAPEGRTFLNWTDQETEDFGNAFSLTDFELVIPQREGEEGYVRVRVPASAEAILVESLANSQRTTEAFESPLEKQSQERMKDFIGESVNAAHMTEEQEADIIQDVGRYVEISDLMEDQPDEGAVQDLRGHMRMIAHRTDTAQVASALKLAAAFSWENYMDNFRAKYQSAADIPQDVEAEIKNTYEKYETVKGLIDRDILTGQVPRFQVISSSGGEIFRSIPALT